MSYEGQSSRTAARTKGRFARIAIGAGMMLSAMAVVPAVALAHHVTSTSLDCTGRLTLVYASFSRTEPVTLTANPSGAIQTLTLDGHGIVVVQEPAGTSSVGGHWAEGQFVATAPSTCSTPPPTPPTPPTTTPPTTTPPTTTPPPPPPPPSSPPVSTPPALYKLPYHGPACVRLKVGQVKASIGPQRLIAGEATLRASGPASVSSITVRVYGVGASHVWRHTIRGHRLVVRLDVTSTAIWGINPSVSNTYGVHRVTIVFRSRCSSRLVTLTYNNQDSPHRG